MRKLENYGAIKEGKLSISHRDKFIEAIKQFDDCRIRIIIEKLYRKRSIDQNAYYFGVICYEFQQGALEMWQEKITIEEAHEKLKANCNYVEHINIKTGEIRQFPQTTTKHTTVEAMEYYDRCIKFIKEWFGRDVDPPGEQSEMEF